MRRLTIFQDSPYFLRKRYIQLLNADSVPKFGSLGTDALSMCPFSTCAWKNRFISVRMVSACILSSSQLILPFTFWMVSTTHWNNSYEISGHNSTAPGLPRLRRLRFRTVLSLDILASPLELSTKSEPSLSSGKVSWVGVKWSKAKLSNYVKAYVSNGERSNAKLSKPG